MGKKWFLDGHRSPETLGTTALGHPGLLWPCSLPRSEDSAVQGMAPTRSWQPLEIIHQVSWTLGSTFRAYIGLFLRFVLAAVCTSNHRGHLFVVSFGHEEKGGWLWAWACSTRTAVFWYRIPSSLEGLRVMMKANVKAGR